jgi:hypothetical protein
MCEPACVPGCVPVPQTLAANDCPANQCACRLIVQTNSGLCDFCMVCLACARVLVQKGLGQFGIARFPHGLSLSVGFDLQEMVSLDGFRLAV